MKQLYFGDCLDVLKELNDKHPAGLVDLIYIDPPFNSKRNYNILFEDIDMKDVKAQREAFADTWSNVSYKDGLREIADLNINLYHFLKNLDRIDVSKSTVAYLTTIAHRLHYMHRLLKETGSFYLHCDPTMSHYLKIVCDLVFGRNCFRNEVVWYYRRWTNVSKKFKQMHDIILFYSKSNDITFNKVEVEPTKSQQAVIERGYNVNKVKSKSGKALQLLIYDKEKVDELVKAGKIDLKKYDNIVHRDTKLTEASDVWEIQYIHSQAKERLGYPTQKPEALLERIISASSNEGDLVADFFCGCGTSVSVANRLNRNWLGVDISHLAIKLILKRLTDGLEETAKKEFLSSIEINGFPKDIASAKELAVKDKKGRIDFQEWVVEFLLGGILNPKKTADGGWDGYLTFPKNDGEKGILLIEVKSGNCNVKNIREYINVVDGQNADIGVFVCFADSLTKPMLEATKDAGNYENYKFDRIQILTIEDIFEGKFFRLPGGVENTTFFSAKADVRSKAASERLI